ncbi:MAG: lysylphosphatidylglycerol synthase domain-containing protein [Beijerinckiaceae bacterium]
MADGMAVESVRKKRHDRQGAALLVSPAATVPLGASPVNDPHEAVHQRRRRIARIVGGLASLAISLISIFVLARTVATIRFADLRGAIAGTTAEQIVGAVLLTAISYLALSGYDAVALRQLKTKVRYRTTLLASFTSYAISFTLGFPLITGGTVRYWIYSRAGLRASLVASLTIIAGVTFWLGMGLIIGVGLVFEARALSLIDHLTPGLNIAIGIGILAVLAAYLIWVSLAPRRRRIQGFRLELPGLKLTAGQGVLGVIDLCAAAGTLFILLPAHHGLDFFTFAATYVFACVLGIASQAPGGIGVFEATMLKVVPTPTGEALLASLLLFRVIYYVVPFVLALALLGANESFQRWQSLREAMLKSQELDED